ncbi:uncharacterized protein LOC128182222 [Crassostrea angulata]|uniref:uncharacterized protein LOC128182222 n=1 Tax=Magallana angulata TaxID=2784310 RepID=UPI0022B0D97F|nr:uncharacterized protein LOC128182222 [Crassostrea angulata]
MYMHIKAIRNVSSIESNNAIMGSFRSMFFIFGLVDYFVIGIAVEPHSTIKGNVESLLELTQWTWKHINTSLKVDSPVTVDVSLTSHYRLTGKDLNKFLKLQKQRDCASILKAIPNTKGRDGVYTIYPDMKTKKLVYCDMTTDGGGWTVIQRRMDGSVNFYRSWQTYKDGFGKPQGEHWLGNEDIHLLTSKTKQELRVDLQKFSGEKAYAKYSRFTVGRESEKYKLSVGGYSGTAGDSLAYHNGMKFSTRDQDNDTWKKQACSVERQGGWWFKSCIDAHVNEPYLKSAKITAISMHWYKFGNEVRALKRASMMIRPTSLFWNMFFIFGLVDLFVIGIAVEPHSTIKGNVESLLELIPWTWKHLNTSLKVDSPVTVDVSLTSHYRLTGKHLNKLLRLQKQRDCASILKTIPNTRRRDGVYTIYPDMKTKKLVYCDMTTDGRGWTVIQRRMDGSEDFYRSWQTYKAGFGKPQGEYWLGNEDIHLLTTKTSQELRVDLKKFSGEKAYAKYSTFTVGSESQKYMLTVGGYSGTAGNVESLLELTAWTWKHLNTSLKVDSPVTVDVSLTSHYRLTGKHLNKLLRLQKQRDCASILKTIPNTKGRDGVYTIYPDMKTRKLVYCDMTADGGGWTVIQRRMDGSEDFNRSWQTYKAGFGKPQGEYWLGNEDIHLLTTRTSQELRVNLQKFSGEKAYAKYFTFTVESESQKYILTVGGYSGTAGKYKRYQIIKALH